MFVELEDAIWFLQGCGVLNESEARCGYVDAADWAKCHLGAHAPAETGWVEGVRACLGAPVPRVAERGVQSQTRLLWRCWTPPNFFLICSFSIMHVCCSCCWIRSCEIGTPNSRVLHLNFYSGRTKFWPGPRASPGSPRYGSGTRYPVAFPFRIFERARSLYMPAADAGAGARARVGRSAQGGVYGGCCGVGDFSRARAGDVVQP